jgi:beta-glucanase (GH16 family)
MKIKKLPIAVCTVFILTGFILSCSSENSGESDRLYKINFNSMPGGSVTSNYESAKKNTTVRLTIRPDAGYNYAEGSLKVNDGQIALTFNGTTGSGDTRYTFEMPGRDVTVSCNFALIQVLPGDHSVYIGNMTGGSVTADKSTAQQGDTITLNVEPAPGYELTLITVTKDTGGTVGTSISGSDRTFIMPDANVTVTAVFSAIANFNYTQDYYASKNFIAADCSFYDKFEGASLDLTKWGYQNGNGSQYGNTGWGNNESQAYAAENVVIENGILKLTARKEAKYNRNYTSGKIVTANSGGYTAVGEPEAGKGKKFGQTYGRMEAKIRMSKTFQGAWPAFWMMPVDNFYGNWPRSGEIDIMEMVGVRPNRASSTLHMKPDWGTWESQYQSVNCTFQNSSDFTDWHVYGVYWTETEITFLLDGYVTRTLTPAWWHSAWYNNNGFTVNSAPFDKDFHLILNLALDSGQFSADNALPANPNLPASMEIEWVRCYTIENDPWPKSFGTHPSNLRQNGGN